MDCPQGMASRCEPDADLCDCTGSNARPGPSVKITSRQPVTAVAGVPAKYAALYTEAGQTCDAVSPALLAAQGKQESGFNPRAGSHVGAKGIAQFMDRTWAKYGNGGDVWNPEHAIKAQARYMCQLDKDVSRFPGDKTSLMLAAYNAGSGAVAKYGGIPPYKETQSYVRSIKSMIKETQ
jgi:soluble lytic murein transglycosylase-like protein